MALMKMGLAIFANPRVTGTLSGADNSTHRGLLFDFTGHAGSEAEVEFETDVHGFSFLRVRASMRQMHAVRVYDMAPSQHLVLNDGINIIFEGRIEDRKLIPGGVEIIAYGYWNSLRDRPITGLWSSVDLNRWFFLDQIDRSDMGGTDVWVTRKDNEIFFGMRNGEIYPVSSDDTRAGCGWVLPANSINWIERIEFDYEVNLPNSYTMDLYIGSNALGGLSGPGSREWFEQGAGVGSPVTGSVISIAVPSFEGNALWFEVSGGSYTHTGETGEAYGKVSNIRIKSKNQVTITARDVIVDVLDDTTETLGTTDFTPLSRSSDEIIDPGIDLDEAIYEDMDRSALITNTATIIRDRGNR
jgi:hypothetical protein